MYTADGAAIGMQGRTALLCCNCASFPAPALSSGCSAEAPCRPLAMEAADAPTTPGVPLLCTACLHSVPLPRATVLYRCNTDGCLVSYLSLHCGNGLQRTRLRSHHKLLAHHVLLGLSAIRWSAAHCSLQSCSESFGCRSALWLCGYCLAYRYASFRLGVYGIGL